MRLSDVNDLFSSKAFAGWRKQKEQDVKMQLAMLDRLDNVAQAIIKTAKAR